VHTGLGGGLRGLPDLRVEGGQLAWGALLVDDARPVPATPGAMDHRAQRRGRPRFVDGLGDAVLLGDVGGKEADLPPELVGDLHAPRRRQVDDDHRRAPRGHR
jgi:hypothetical protein